jgi:hypothetical protein
VKTKKAAIAAGVFAGLTALPLTTASADTSSAPNGTASGAALTVTLSLAPIRNLVNTAGSTAGGAFSWQTLTDTLDQLQGALCGATSSTPVGCPINLDVLKDMPDTLQVAVAQANDNALLNATATDIASGHADSSPLYTNWASLNANLTNLGNAVNTLVDQVTTALASGNATLAEALVTNGLAAASGLDLGNVLSVDTTHILGTVAADLPNAKNNPFSSATALSVAGSGPLSGVNVQVDPFTACAANAALFSQCPSATGAETAGANTLVSAGLPALDLSNASAANLPQLASTLKTLLNAVTNAIADPSNAGSILSSAPLPSQLSGPLGTIGGLLNTAGGTVSGTTASSPISLDLLKQWDAQLSTMVDSLNAIINAVAGLNLPDVTKLLTSTNDIATAKTVPTTGGGVLSTATSTLGSISLLPVGDTLAKTLNSVLGSVPAVGGISLKQLSAATPVLEVDGITSNSEAGVGSAPACGTNADGTPQYVCGGSGLQTVSVLGQTIDLDHGTLNGTSLPVLQGGLPAGAEWHQVLTIPSVGSVTLDIVRGLPQIISDTPLFRSVQTSALNVRLLNGSVGCSTNHCTDLITGAPSTNTSTKTASTGGATGIAALGADGTTVAGLGIANSAAAAGMTACTINCGGGEKHHDSQAGLPETGMFGGGALPMGLGLIAVAISLRLVPSLRLRLRRVR